MEGLSLFCEKCYNRIFLFASTVSQKCCRLIFKKDFLSIFSRKLETTRAAAMVIDRCCVLRVWACDDCPPPIAFKTCLNVVYYDFPKAAAVLLVVATHLCAVTAHVFLVKVLFLCSFILWYRSWKAVLVTLLLPKECKHQKRCTYFFQEQTPPCHVSPTHGLLRKYVGTREWPRVGRKRLCLTRTREPSWCPPPIACSSGLWRSQTEVLILARPLMFLEAQLQPHSWASQGLVWRVYLVFVCFFSQDRLERLQRTLPIKIFTVKVVQSTRRTVHCCFNDLLGSWGCCCCPHLKPVILAACIRVNIKSSLYAYVFLLSALICLKLSVSSNGYVLNNLVTSRNYVFISRWVFTTAVCVWPRPPRKRPWCDCKFDTNVIFDNATRCCIIFSAFWTVLPIVDVGDRTRHVIQGETVVIPCRITSGNPAPERFWSKGRRPFEPNTRVHVSINEHAARWAGSRISLHYLLMTTEDKLRCVLIDWEKILFFDSIPSLSTK